MYGGWIVCFDIEPGYDRPPYDSPVKLGEAEADAVLYVRDGLKRSTTNGHSIGQGQIGPHEVELLELNLGGEVVRLVAKPSYVMADA